MTSRLDNLCGPGRPLRQELPDANEINGLKRSGNARLTDAKNSTLSLESRFDLAYNAAHALCLAALRQRGYRPAIGEYEGDMNVDQRIVTDLITACDRVSAALETRSSPSGTSGDPPSENREIS